MDDSDDPIKKLLEQTGWTYADILKKLETNKTKYESVTKPSVDLKQEDKRGEGVKVKDFDGKNSETEKSECAYVNSETDTKHKETENIEGYKKLCCSEETINLQNNSDRDVDQICNNEESTDSKIRNDVTVNSKDQEEHAKMEAHIEENKGTENFIAEEVSLQICKNKDIGTGMQIDKSCTNYSSCDAQEPSLDKFSDLRSTHEPLSQVNEENSQQHKEKYQKDVTKALVFQKPKDPKNTSEKELTRNPISETECNSEDSEDNQEKLINVIETNKQSSDNLEICETMQEQSVSDLETHLSDKVAPNTHKNFQENQEKSLDNLKAACVNSLLQKNYEFAQNDIEQSFNDSKIISVTKSPLPNNEENLQGNDETSISDQDSVSNQEVLQKDKETNSLINLSLADNEELLQQNQEEQLDVLHNSSNKCVLLSTSEDVSVRVQKNISLDDLAAELTNKSSTERNSVEFEERMASNKLSTNSKNDSLLPALQDDCKTSQALSDKSVSEDGLKLHKHAEDLSQKSNLNYKPKKHVNSKECKQSGNYSNTCLRIIRKYKHISKKVLNKKAASEAKTTEVEEDIRSKLKEQLELLRNKRKTPDFPLTTNKPVTNSEYVHHNRSRLNKITNALIQKLSDTELGRTNLDRSNNSSLKMKSKREDGPLEDVLLSNDSDFMIVNVVGGYKSPSPETRNEENSAGMEMNCNKIKHSDINSDVVAISKKTQSDGKSVVNGIKPTKTKDVTKIKGWKNKKFAVPKDIQEKPSKKLCRQLNSSSESSSNSEASILDKESSVEDSSSSMEKQENSNVSNSAFISDALDQYLTENSQLNISYEIPKLDAEQTITKTYIDIKFPEFPQSSTRAPPLKNKDGYKPKTLAEKRKMLCESQPPQIKDFMISMNSKQRKDYEESVLNMRKKLIEENVPFTRRCFMASTSITNTHSFVVYNGRKYKVPNSKNKEIVTEIKDKRKMYKSACTQHVPNRCPRKPSLLNSLKTDVKTIPYNPHEWETVEVKLPKLSLQVTPQIGKCIDPKVEHFLHTNDTILTQERVDYALSTLKAKYCSSDLQTFTFPVPYINNQKSISVRRRITAATSSPRNVSKPIITESDGEIRETVITVINKMLDYVEMSEATLDIIQVETAQDNCQKPEDLVDGLQTGTILDSNGLKHKRRRRGKYPHKTTLEMKRLNCKVVSISIDEENGESKPCEKEFCKMGCVCRSIECSAANLLPNHCGLVGCMFGCTCNYLKTDMVKNISLPSGTNIFSEGIINRLQDEVKKNLAKVEKEFTQTIIRANNQIIIVGDSKERRRRATKMPRKYEDFVEEDPGDNTKVTPKYVAAKITYRALTSGAYENEVIKPCFVKLLKYNFDDIIPLCMVHSLYKCHCRNKAVFDSGVNDKSIVGCTVFCPPKPTPSPPPKTTPGKRYQLKPRSNKTFNKELFSSRTRGLSTSYYLTRNKSFSHKSKLIKSSKKLQKDLEKYLRQNAAKIMEEAGDKPTAESSENAAQALTASMPKHRRKQSLVLLKDVENETLRRSPSVLIPETTNRSDTTNLPNCRTKPISTLPDIEQQPDISVSTPKKSAKGCMSKLKEQFVALLGRKSSNLRLLPWATLAIRFENGTFQLWYSSNPKTSQLVITENGKRPTANHYNVKLFERMPQDSAIPSDIIRWLIYKKLPEGKLPDNILLILSFSKGFWEICAVCEKNNTDSTKSTNSISISLIESFSYSPDGAEVSASDEPSGDSTLEKSRTTANQPVTNHPDETRDERLTGNYSDGKDGQEVHTETLVHENLQENKKIMYCSKRRFQPKKLISDGMHNDVLKIRQVLWAPIPSVTLACKWRVICMNLGFAYLSLSRSSYTIKYDDIMKAVKLAQVDKTTIVLKSEELQKNYPHRNFGIYCVHNYSDKIFVGPYFLNENHDVDTLSFVNSVLVNTNLFNQIKGKSVPGSGFWFHQATSLEDKSIDDDVMIVQDPPAVVDLTCDSDEESGRSNRKNFASLERPASSATKEAPLLKHMLVSPPSYPDVDDETAKAEKALDTLLKAGQLNVNRTLKNLKHLGKVIRSPSKTLSKINIAASKSANNPEKLSDSQDSSEWDDEDKLVIDEAFMQDQNSEQLFREEATSNSRKSLDVSSSPLKNHSGDIRCLRYLVTNIPELGYITAYQHENSKIVDATCPITQKAKRFPTSQAAVQAVQRVLSKRFILVPAHFELEVRMVEKLESNAAPLDRSVLNGYHIVGECGVKDIQNCTSAELREFGLDKFQANHAIYRREKKMLLAPITQLAKLLNMSVTPTSLGNCLIDILEKTLKEVVNLQNKKSAYTNEIIELETKKMSLVETYSKLLVSLPPEQKSKGQQELDRIINSSNTLGSSSAVVTTNSRSSSLDTMASGSADEKSRTTQEKNTSSVELIDLLDDTDEIISSGEESVATTLKTKPITITGSKIRLAPYSTSKSLLTGKKVEVTGHSIPRSILMPQSKVGLNTKDNLTNKYVVVTQKRNAFGKIVNCGGIDLSKCSFQLRPTGPDEKMLIKEVPIKVKRDLMQLNNTVLQKRKVVIPSTTTSTMIKTSENKIVTKAVLSNVQPSPFNRLSKITPVSLGTNTVSGSTAAPTVCPNGTLMIPRLVSSNPSKNKVVNVVSSSGKPIMRVPVSVSNHLATIAPAPKSGVFTKQLVIPSKSAPNYVAIKDGPNMRYFQLVSDTNKSTLQPVQAIKRPNSSVAIQPPAKKIALSTSLIMNQKEKVDK